MHLEDVLRALKPFGKLPVDWSDDSEGLAVTMPDGKIVVAPFERVVPTLINALYEIAPEHFLCVPEPGHHYVERVPVEGQEAERVDTFMIADERKTVIFGTCRNNAFTLSVSDFNKKYYLES